MGLVDLVDILDQGFRPFGPGLVEDSSFDLRAERAVDGARIVSQLVDGLANGREGGLGGVVQQVGSGQKPPDFGTAGRCEFVDHRPQTVGGGLQASLGGFGSGLLKVPFSCDESGQSLPQAQI